MNICYIYQRRYDNIKCAGLWNFNQVMLNQHARILQCQLHINSLATVFTRSEAAATEYFMLAR